MVQRRRISAAGVLLLSLAACESGPPPPSGTTTAMPLEAAIEQVATVLEQERLEVDRTEQGLRATSTAAGFTRCDPVSLRIDSGDSDRNVFTPVSEPRAEAAIRFMPDDGHTAVRWQTTYTGRYHNRVNNTWFERRCRGTGSLERLLETSLRG